MRIPEDYHTCNVADQMERPDSVLAFWKQMLALRKEREHDLVSRVDSAPLVR